ncbi:PREDICTED: 1-Cys peroxiredoxin-like [Nelumbo nucifera]|uniref:Peroxiredoxin n=1 Tax=Nelumbo nucifera TaxID=4432 RepID=A0A1U8B6F0_NELNU|nr:PREDICTED: 1-Cys peroxiredoxin-like [Nelumbo nucifera]
MPGLTIGDTLPDLEVETTHGSFKLHDFVGNDWAIIFSHPADFTPVCTTELGKMALYEKEFNERGVKLLGVSCDDIQSHKDWIKDIEAYTPGCKVKYPIVADPKKDIIKQLNMVDPDAKDPDGSEVPSRALHVVAPDKKIKLSILYPATTGRNMEEVLRVVDSLQKTAKYKVATPVNWKPGEPVVISPSVSNDEANVMFPQGYTTVDLPSGKEYLRFTNI